MPEIPPVIPGEFIFDTWGNPVARRTVQRYTDAADLATLNPTPQIGDVAYLLDTGVVQYWDGAVWDSGGALALTGGQMTGAINMGGHVLNGLATPTGPSGAVPLNYLVGDIWTTPNLENSWESFGASVQYRKDTLGNVTIRGNMRNGTANAGTLLFVISTPSRPPVDVWIPVASAAGVTYISITTADGALRLQETIVLGGGFLSMSGVAYSTVP